MSQKGFALPKFRVLRFILFGILFMVIGASFTAMAYNSRIPTAQAAPSFQEPDLPNAPEGGRNCTATEIFVADDRIHVRCSTASPAGVYYYAIQADAAHQLKANRLLVLMNTAVATGEALYVIYDDNSAHNPPGCSVSDCRLLITLNLLAAP